jgi:TetR/AcrR family transcriptional repressor of nem operon
MRYPSEHKRQTHDRIVRAASRRFRRRGREGAGIGDLMRDLRLTHGGFYRHFASKDELFVEAFEQALGEARERFRKAVAHAAPGRELEALIDSYLDVEHCDGIEDGCPVAALTTEIPRESRESRERMLQALRTYVTDIQRYVPGADDQERRRNTVALLSGMAGTLSVARAFSSVEDRRRILDGARAFYLRALTNAT